MNVYRNLFAAIILLSLAGAAAAEPTVIDTKFLGPLTGEEAALHPDNVTPNHIEYYGTDLGFTYAHNGRLQFLFGDTWATEAYAPAEKSSGARLDDSYGTIDLDDWPDPAVITPQNLPRVRLGQNPGSTEVAAIDPGFAMDLGKTPEAGFSNGSNEFAIFLLGKPQGCVADADCDNGMTCDSGLGYAGTAWTQEEGYTAGCMDGDAGCTADTMTDAAGKPVPNSGFCADRTSTIRAETPAGRIAAMALRQRVAVRDTAVPKKYTPVTDWQTNKFLNTTVSTVQAFAAGQADHDYRIAGKRGAQRRVFLWGRPGFVGVGASKRPLGLYFAWVDMPVAPDFRWQLHYFTGVDDTGLPLFSTRESDAVPVDMDPGHPGIQVEPEYDVVDQMSVAWVDRLHKWVMFYGGGMGKLPSPPLPDCGVLQAFARSECGLVDVGNGAMRMRSADDPWGPWSLPQDLIPGGDPDVPGSGQYGPGGALHHPACTDPRCAPHSDTPFYHDNEYGFFYSANIIEQWIRPAGEGVDVLWNASTWDPYRVVLLRTRINP